MQFLLNFEKNKSNLLIKRGIYIYGKSGTGKTFFIKDILKSMNYDIIYYNSNNIRNKSALESVTNNHISDTNVHSMLVGKKKQMVLVMDEIDSMKDKGGLTYLIKLIRCKKTKKQQKEQISQIPIICIGNNIEDRKMKELIKVCTFHKFSSPTNDKLLEIIKLTMPNLDNLLINTTLQYIENDLRKLDYIYNLYNSSTLCEYKQFLLILQKKNNNNNIKHITKQLLLNEQVSNNLLYIKDIINDTDKTSVALLWHENVIDILDTNKHSDKYIDIYYHILNNICLADYIDRIIFQKQLWELNELSFFIKTMYNNLLIHTHCSAINPLSIRFTKILTKYSSEYNNYMFFQNLSTNLHMNKKNIFLLFLMFYSIPDDEQEDIYDHFEQHNIFHLDVNRMLKYLNTIIEE
jgi:hypothetical protein